MPPLPSTLDEQTQQLVSSAQRLQHDLVDFQIPRLRGCKGPLATQQRLAAELREDIDRLARYIETLEIAIGDQRHDRDRKGLAGIVDDLKTAFSSIRTSSRSALLKSNSAIQSQTQSRRDELLAAAVSQKKHFKDEKSDEDSVTKASNRVTDTLRRTLTLMQGELERSVLTNQMLDGSTANLRSTNTAHDRITDLMDTSKQLITALKNSDSLDRLLIICALIFFVLVVLFIFKQRILDRGIRLAFWWTRFLPDLSPDAGVIQMEQGDKPPPLLAATATSTGATIITTAMSSVVAAVSSSHISTVLAPLSSELFESHDNITLPDDPSSDDASTLKTETDSTGFSAATTTPSEPQRTSSKNVHEEL